MMETPTEGSILRACNERLTEANVESNKAFGSSFDLYEFTENNNPQRLNALKAGNVFHVTSKDRITLVQGQGRRLGVIVCQNKTVVRIETSDENNEEQLQRMVNMGLELKHIGILRPCFAGFNDQLRKNVFGLGWHTTTFEDWLTRQGTKTVNSYLTSFEKEMLVTLYTGIEYIWNKGFTIDSLDDSETYVMTDRKIKILPSAIRPKNPEDTEFFSLKLDLADMLATYLLPIWPGVEFEDFINYLRSPFPSTEDILGHPILCSPTWRQLMYRECEMNYGQINVLVEKITTFGNWPKICTQQIQQNYPGLYIIFLDRDKKGENEPGVYGAVRFGNAVSSHYTQHADRMGMQDDTVDRSLKDTLPGLITKKYALRNDPEYTAVS